MKKEKKALIFRLLIVSITSLIAVSMIFVTLFLGIGSPNSINKSKEYSTGVQLTFDIKLKNKTKKVTRQIAEEAAESTYKKLDPLESQSPPRIEIEEHGSGSNIDYKLRVNIPNITNDDEAQAAEELINGESRLSFYSQKDAPIFNEKGFNSGSTTQSAVPPDKDGQYDKHTDEEQGFLFKSGSAKIVHDSRILDNKSYNISLDFSDTATQSMWNDAVKAFKSGDNKDTFVAWLDHDDLRDKALRQEPEGFKSDGYDLYSFMYTKVDGKRTNVLKEEQFHASNYLMGPILAQPGLLNHVTLQGHFTKERATELASRINYGMSSFQLDLSKKGITFTYPTLGLSAFQKSLIVGGIIFAVIVAFLIGNYGLLGLIASISTLLFAALSLYLVKVMGAEYSPEIIGAIMLGVALATNANIITFERLKNEIYQGFSPAKSVTKVNRLTFFGIFDSNLLLLLIGFVMFFMAHQLIKGFSVTFIVSLTMSLVFFGFFTKLLTTILIQTNLFEKRRKLLGIWKEKSIPSEYQQLTPPKHHNYTYSKQGKKIGIGSGVIVIIGIVVFGVLAGLGGAFASGLNTSKDFGSRQRWTVENKNSDPFTKSEINKIESYFDDHGFEGSVEKIYSTINNKDGTLSEVIELQFTSSGREFGSQLNSDKKTPVIAGVSDLTWEFYNRSNNVLNIDLAKDAVYVILVAMAITAAYVMIRFRWTYGLAALLSIMHDLIVLGAVIIITRAPLSTTMVMAILLMVLYSIFEKVVILDKIRERMYSQKLNQVHSKESLVKRANLAIGASLKRTLLMNILMIVIGALYIATFGSISWTFGLIVIISTIIGSVSTVFIIPAMWIKFETYRQKRIVIREKKNFWKTKGVEEQTIETINDFNI